MLKLIRFYLLLFSLFAIVFFLISLVFDYFIFQRNLDFPGLAFKSLFYGLWMSLILGTFHLLNIKKQWKQGARDNFFGSSHYEDLHSKITIEKLLEVLQSDKEFGKMKIKAEESQIFIESPMTLKSWGEYIKIKKIGVDENNQHYLISSSPKLKTTILDYGKNTENVDKILKIMESHNSSMV